MFKSIMNKKGVALLMVLGTLLVVLVLANVVLAIISSQTRLTHHQISRIQAYYAAWAGINYALEQLRTGAWTVAPTNSCSPPNGCVLVDNDFPATIQNRQVRIVLRAPGTTDCQNPPGGTACVSATTIYTYTP
ncbi:MAG: hypothetical protein NC928_00975 [Candidatus Omnitrophica bacterium]|nr:hypothetical protein [Candidatus Omnitrophota bacterium]